MTLRPHHFLPQASLTPCPKPSIKPNPKHKPPHSLTPKPLNSPNHPDAGLQFREKLVYLSTQLNVNPQKALEKNPDFRSCPLSSLHSVERCLSSMGIERAAMGRILDMHPQLLTVDPHRHLYPVFDFLLHDAAIPFHDIRKSILRCPRLLVCDVTSQLRPALHFLTRLGFKRVTSQTTVLLVSSVKSTLLPKVEYLQSLGLSKKEVETMVVRSPALLTLSIENNYKPKVEYLVEEMKRDVKELKRFPQYFSFSLDGKIKPRHRLLVDHGFSLPLREMLMENLQKQQLMSLDGPVREKSSSDLIPKWITYRTRNGLYIPFSMSTEQQLSLSHGFLVMKTGISFYQGTRTCFLIVFSYILLRICRRQPPSHVGMYSRGSIQQHLTVMMLMPKNEAAASNCEIMCFLKDDQDCKIRVKRIRTFQSSATVQTPLLLYRLIVTSEASEVIAQIWTMQTSKTNMESWKAQTPVI